MSIQQIGSVKKDQLVSERIFIYKVVDQLLPMEHF